MVLFSLALWGESAGLPSDVLDTLVGGCSGDLLLGLELDEAPTAKGVVPSAAGLASGGLFESVRRPEGGGLFLGAGARSNSRLPPTETPTDGGGSFLNLACATTAAGAGTAGGLLLPLGCTALLPLTPQVCDIW
eukprot:CAMPEP_0173415702 /NCGR_PEP_ID=MMETSP1356-20130122/85002_1 /TAXON_ID=77927 ORGANISM="Hemiselmis virescens, Strain PCC157" /NCGR_SAMPLE_ID=MMETSP1356 /ASSEMBLY_ACC=CAM_ASM_000847 /LENGTH=133 /DNA_ID=CAMNT_0014377971 /DNA_START=578 /DNA_END=977 /DNA_ORIENTATION=-